MFEQIGYFICIPFAWLTRLFYSLTSSYGVALILFTLVVKLVLIPFQLKSKKSMLRMNRMQDKVKELQERYAKNPQRQQQEIADLYAREGINPMGGCLWSLLPFPIMIALYYIIRLPLRYLMNISTENIAKIGELASTLGYQVAGDQSAGYDQIFLTKFIHENWSSFEGKFEGLIDLDYNFLGMDLAATPNALLDQFPGGGWPVWGILMLPILATVIQFVMTFINMKTTGGASGQNKTMFYLMPLMTLWMGYMLPAALCVYWIANSFFMLVQEVTLNKFFNKILDREETEKEREKREKRAAKLEASRAKMAAQQATMESAKNKGGKKPQPQQNKAKKQNSTNENGRVGQRPYARGRSFSEDHYND
ncbi:MAG: YidC/Oxa1 family membrane protein insertase [Ruminococcaceae bacterium]|nr:YidC/Oxa1 family membrane protein insertase [Oscillospiraceae bacterium]